MASEGLGLLLCQDKEHSNLLRCPNCVREIEADLWRSTLKRLTNAVWKQRINPSIDRAHEEDEALTNAWKLLGKTAPTRRNLNEGKH